MNSSKKINVNFSSLVGLKAELLRKQTEVKEAKIKAESVYTVPKLNKKNKKLKSSDLKDKLNQLIDVDDINAHKKSKLMLEAKARLYERLKKSKTSNENFLVDFTSKSDESEEEEYFNEADYDDRNSDPEESWVEYEDCFGRTRKCLRKDLSFMRKKDDLVKEQVMRDRNKEADTKNQISQSFVVQEKEPEIEIMRRKWDEQTEKLADKVNIHYQDVLFDEARAHGVGYYAFSQDEEERAKQQENLAKLRKQTEQKQKEMKELKDLKDKIEQNRLKAARIRQRIRAGLPAEPTEEETLERDAAENELINAAAIVNKSMEKEPTNNSVTKPDEKKSEEQIGDAKEQNEKDDVAVREDKIKALGELLGKKTHWREMSQEEWIYKRREDRDMEFAPVYDNFKRAGYLNEERDESLSRVASKDILGDVKDSTSDREKSDTVLQEDKNDVSKSVEDIGMIESDIIGPMPHTSPLPPITSVPPVPSVAPVPPVHSIPPPSLVPPATPVLSVFPLPTIVPMPSSETNETSAHNDTSVYRTDYPVNTDYNHQGYSWNMSGDPQTNYYATLNPMAMYQHPYYNYIHNAPYIHNANSSATPVQTVSYPNITNAIPAVSPNDAAGKSNAEPVPPGSKTIDEEKIAAGLKYLREKFEKRQNT